MERDDDERDEALVSGEINSRPAPKRRVPGRRASSVIADVEDEGFDLAAIWREHDIGDADRMTVKRAQMMLEQLPAETEASVKKQIVAASLAAFEIAVDDIIAAASKQVEALESYLAKLRDEAEAFAQKSDDRIRMLEAEIDEIRRTVHDSEDKYARLAGAAGDVIADVVPVLDFFHTGEPSKPRFKVAAGPAKDD